METKPFNLALEKELIAEIKIQAIREDRTVSEIATQLFREYLARQTKSKSGKKPKLR
jgi:hypothetical protein